MKIIQIIKTALAIIGLVALGILTGAFLSLQTKGKKDDEVQKSKEEKKNEIENTPAGILVSSACNSDDLRSKKDGIKSDFRDRIRNRLGEELHRLGGSITDSDSGTGSGTIDR